jgi:hypothetical protein
MAGSIVVSGIVAGAAMYYLQVYGFYEPVSASAEITLTSVSGTAEPLPVSDFQGIDAESSPLRYRACFTVPVSLATLTESIVIAEDPVPLNGPGWFDCYDAAAVAALLRSGDAVAFLGTAEIHPGVDRIIAIARDGRGYAWHQLNGSLGD